VLVSTLLQDISANVLLTGAVITALSATIGALVFLWKKIAKIVGKFDQIYDDWSGLPDRPGVPGHAGVMERLERMEDRQVFFEGVVTPNGGSSLRDAVDQIASLGGRLEKRSDTIELLLRQHLKDGEYLLEVGIENDAHLWEALDQAGITIPYRDIQQSSLRATSALAESLEDDDE
jgi:hypothetical protein